ncbi:MAG: Tm-1-like ATP-binding domain-containing protein, partial [Gimesia sp.]|nr:Tm-1-like ATP-binding domain-containing protein [Gimesia sp.]
MADCIRHAGLDVVLVDLSTRGNSDLADIMAHTIAQAHPAGPDNVLGQTDRGQAVTAMSEALRHWLSGEVRSERVAGVIALGGSGG